MSDWKKVPGPFYGEVWIDCPKCSHSNEIPLEKDMNVLCVFICDKCEETLFCITPCISDKEN